MRKLAIWFKVFLITILLAAPASLAVLFKERVRKNQIIDREKSYYESLQTNLYDFKRSQEALLSDQIRKNKQDMESAKMTYDYLLSQQAAIVKDNSQLVQVGQATNTTSLASSNTGTSSSTSTKTTTSKPKTTTKTKSS